MHLIIADINSKLRLPNVARALGISEGLTYKLGEDPERSGKAPSLSSLLKIIAYAASNPDPIIQDLVDELLAFIVVPAGRRLVRQDLIERLGADVEALRSGRAPQTQGRETLLLCNECDQPLQIIAGANGRLRYECAGCKGNG